MKYKFTNRIFLCGLFFIPTISFSQSRAEEIINKTNQEIKNLDCIKVDFEYVFINSRSIDSAKYTLTQYLILTDTTKFLTEKYDFLLEDNSNKNQNYYKKDSLKYRIHKKKKKYYDVNKPINNVLFFHLIYPKIIAPNTEDTVVLDSNNTHFIVTIKQKNMINNLTVNTNKYTIRKDNFFISEVENSSIKKDYSSFNLLKTNMEKITPLTFYSVLDSAKNALEKSFTYISHEDEKRDTVLLKKAPDFNIKTISNKEINNQSEKLILIDFWFSQCNACLHAMPSVQKLHEKYMNKGLLVFGPNVHDKDTLIINKVKQKFNITYDITMDAKGLAKEFKAYAYPTIYLINKKGEILYHVEGFSLDEMEKLDKIIEQELEE